MPYETRNNVKKCLDIDPRIYIECHEWKDSDDPRGKWVKAQKSLYIGDQCYSLSYFGDALTDMKVKKQEIVFITTQTILQDNGESDGDLSLYNPTVSLVREIKHILGSIPKLKITLEIQ